MKSGIAAMLNRLRRESGRSQRVVAGELGISQALLSHYENGAREPKLEFVLRACNYYGVTADYILGRAEREQHTGEFMLKHCPDMAIALAGKVQDVFCELAKTADEELTIAAVNYLGTTAVNIEVPLRDPNFPYDPMRDAEMKQAEAQFIKSVRRSRADRNGKVG